ncbi:Cellulose biosynthesis protein BcsQ [Zhongshania aliphaticivorans]|uniref:Cellulose biosynthesis protein BcsQ n=1 Tax=Zhongshania aliphaticivorans TaxID=1470434 RepID=A0A5S9NJG3_9GAMM|nr:cellulose biosynthesis protein BcsQ [Zhongshania aliphaticivorans]CAA0090268.1 Cellulose biosynthesis protein BcsQ [Zhongshania aliphaticivorans]CAA0097680.1 Cellulose biosynthesis protein BcsQ [Zhongshania aliphaticivorans]
MAVICISSPKGGVGKTTCTANLAYGLRRRGFRVIAVDFDPQNALRLHFGVRLDDGRGFVENAVASEDWSSLTVEIADNLFVLPYGYPSQAMSNAFEQYLRQPAFLRSRFASLSQSRGTVIIADLPPGQSRALSAVAGLADLRLTVLLSDSASISLLPAVENGSYYPSDVPAESRHGLVLNQVDPRSRLNSEICTFMENRFGEEIMGLIHRDEAVLEANAKQRIVFESAPGSLAAQDLDALVNRVMKELIHLEKLGG